MSRFNLDEFNESVNDFLGVAIWWTVSECSIDLDKAREILESKEIPPNFLKEPTSKKALKRAGRRVSKENGRDFLDRKILDNAGKTVTAVVHESKDAVSEKLTYEQRTTAVLDKDSGSLSVYGADSERYLEHFDFFKDRITDSDVRTTIRRVVEYASGISLRDRGAVYFIPRASVGIIVALDEFLRELGVGKIYIMRIPEGENERSVTWEAFEAEIEEKIKSTMEAVEKIEQKTTFLVKHDEKMKEVKKLLAIYADMTDEEVKAEEIRERIAEASKTITEKMAKIRASK